MKPTSDPVDIAPEDSFTEWQDLESFWGEAKHRVHDLDGECKPQPSSLEDHFLRDDFLDEPLAKEHQKRSSERRVSFTAHEISRSIVRGQDINDIPTTYVLGGFKPRELVVIGTYVDKSILPGFRYRVRKNLTDEYLFDGQALCLQSIGLGYGKRLTFQSELLNENDNYFWSDSRRQGYAFTLQTLFQNQVLRIIDRITNQEVGRLTINDPSIDLDCEISSEAPAKGQVQKEVLVKFSADVILRDSHTRQNLFLEDTVAVGVAFLKREGPTARAKLQKVELEDFVLGDCYLVPEK